MTGLVVRVDLFGEVRLVPAPTHFGFHIPTPPNRDGVYDITTTPKENT